MNFTEAVAEINLATKRPDKINVARRKVNAAISFFTLENEFMRDFAEQLVPVNPAEYTQAIALSTLTRFRKFKYLKLAGTKSFLTVLPDTELFRPGENRGRYYIAGSNVNLYMPALTSNLDVGYFQYPPWLTDNSPTHWMLDVCPEMIIAKAAAEVFRDIGDEKSLKEETAAARELYLAFRRDMGISTQ